MQKVYNLESLSEGDLKTYETLHDVINYNKNKPDDFEYELIHIDNQAKLFESFSKIEKESNKQLHPLIHFDVHGNEEGIKLRSGEFIKWSNVLDYFIDINKNCGLKLYLFVGACFGISAIQIIDVFKRAPFSIVIGPNKKVYPDTIKDFYHNFFEQSFNDKLEVFFKDSPLIPDVFSVVGVATLYHRIFDMDVQEKNGILKNHFKNWKEFRKELVNTAESEEALNELYKMDMYIYNEIGRKEQHEHFFMIDLFPENEEVFGME